MNSQALAIVDALLMEEMTAEEAVSYLKGMPEEVRKNYYVWQNPRGMYAFGPSHGFFMVGSADKFLRRHANETIFKSTAKTPPEEVAK